jgi:hypothetical protein
VAQLRRGIELKPVVDWSQMPCRFRLCDNQAAGRGRYCVQHARQVHKGVPLTPLLVGTPCARSGCEEVSRSNLGLCPTHVNLNGHLVREYGITLAQRDELAAVQNGVCAICGGSDGEDLHVDHCHASGAVRGLLCGPCNRALGLMQDDPARLLAAAAYLRA